MDTNGREAPSGNDILARLNLLSEAKDLGLELAEGTANEDGFIKCRAIGREDRNPSASFNVASGFYKDFGGEGEELGFFDLAGRLRFGDWQKAKDHYRGVAFDGSNGKAGQTKPPKVYPTAAEALSAYERELGQHSHQWEYHDAMGKTVGYIVRFPTATGKTTRPISRVNGGWIQRAMPKTRPLYNLAKVIDSPTVYICEGEKATDAAISLKLKATCSAGGSSSPKQSDWSPLADKDVIILPDNDEPGEKYAENVARLAHEAGAKSIKILGLPGRPEGGGDIADIDISMGELLNLVKNADRWEPTDNEEKNATPKRKPKQADLLVEIADGAELFHDPDGIAYATIRVGEHRETWPANSSGFRRWLQRKYWESDKSAPSAQAMTDCLGVIEGKAVFEGREHEVCIRVAGDSDRIIIDLGMPDWSVVAIDSHGWKIDKESPVKFRRAKGMRPLPVPERGGNINQLRQFLNVRNEDWPLAVAWLLMAFNPVGPYPVINLTGEAGSGKSMASRLLRSLVDPNVAPLRSEPKEVRDLVITARNSWVFALDNLSRLTEWLSDALCRLALGGGFATRQLWSNDEEAIFEVKRPAIINGIEDVASRGDLMDRCLNITLERIPEHKRKTEKEFFAEFHAAAPGILGGLFDALVVAIRRLPEVRLAGVPRMADFAVWAVAGESALGLGNGEFMRSYAAAREAANDLVIESSAVGSAIEKLLNRRPFWEGTATGLLGDLEEAMGEAAVKKAGKRWPGSGRGLSGQLRRIAPNLRAKRIAVDFGRGSNRRQIRLEKSGNQPSQPSQPSSTNENTD